MKNGFSPFARIVLLLVPSSQTNDFSSSLNHLQPLYFRSSLDLFLNFVRDHYPDFRLYIYETPQRIIFIWKFGIPPVFADNSISLLCLTPSSVYIFVGIYGNDFEFNKKRCKNASPNRNTMMIITIVTISANSTALS
jgi:hypothetical protein